MSNSITFLMVFVISILDIMFYAQADSLIDSESGHDKVIVTVSEIPYLLSQNESKKGEYNTFLDKLTNIELLFIPPARVELEFYEKSYIDCLFPASTQTMFGDNYLQSKPVNKVNAYLFSKQRLTSADLKDSSRIALRRGFTFGHVRLKYPGQYVELKTDIETAQFLSLGRVDAVIAYLEDFVGAHKELSLPLPFYNKNRPMYSSIDAFVCNDSPKNRRFIEQVNLLIKQKQETID